MTDKREPPDPPDSAPVPAPVVVPYARFLEWRARRGPIAEPTRPDHPPTTDATLVPATAPLKNGVADKA